MADGGGLENRYGATHRGFESHALRQHQHTRPSDEIRLDSRRGGNQVVITVADSGAGMPADQLATIFERFTRLDEARTRDRGGVGLGLAIVKAIARAHGGTVQVRSAPGAGSTFELSLPSATPNSPAGARPNVLPSPRLQEDGLRG